MQLLASILYTVYAITATMAPYMYIYARLRMGLKNDERRLKNILLEPLGKRPSTKTWQTYQNAAVLLLPLEAYY